MAIDDLTRLIAPPKHPLHTENEGPVREIERFMGLTLPQDYVQLAKTYGTGCFGDTTFQFWIHNLLRPGSIDMLNKEIAFWQNFRDLCPRKFAYPIFPDRPGYLPIGADVDGGLIGCLVEGPADSWPLVTKHICAEKFEVHPMALSTFLAKALVHEIRPDCWRPDFPSDLARVTFMPGEAYNESVAYRDDPLLSSRISPSGNAPDLKESQSESVPCTSKVQKPTSWRTADHLAALAEITRLLPPPKYPLCTEAEDERNLRAAEDYLGVTLPPDYTDFIKTYGSGFFRDTGFFFGIHNLLQPKSVDMVKQLIALPMLEVGERHHYPNGIFPARGGYLPIGRYDGGRIGWLVKGPAECWPLVIKEHNKPLEVYPMALSTFLVKVLRHEIRPASWWPTFPSDLATFVPSTALGF
jgi:hypothetical protein